MSGPHALGGPALTRAEVLSLLTDLGARLQRLGLTADLYIVGGAAMALTLDERRVTRDIDAVFSPADRVYQVAAEIAAERGLPREWLSSAVAAFTPHGPDADAVGLDIPGLTVAVASAEHLLAMKLAAGRTRDLGDLVVLFRVLNITQATQAVAIASRLYGPDSVVLSDPEESYLWLAEDVLRSMAGRKELPGSMS